MRFGHLFGKPQTPPPAKSSPSANPPSDALTPAPRDGMVAVKDNRIEVIDPDVDGSCAVIEIPDSTGIQIIADAKPVSGSLQVDSKLHLEVKVSPTAPVRSLQWLPSDDKLSLRAMLSMYPGALYQYKDALVPVRRLWLQVEESPVSPQPFTAEEIMKDLSQAGFVGTVDEQALAELEQSATSTEVVLLQGTPMDPGMPEGYSKVPLKHLYDPLHLHMHIATVTTETIVGLYSSGRPGKPGKDILGVTIPVPEFPPIPILGDGVSDVNGELVTKRNGRLIFTSTLIDVVPELMLEQDISPKDGQVIFDGDVWIGGSVLDGSFIKASGRVVIEGNVMNAHVVSEQGIWVYGNVTGSTLLTGQVSLLYGELHPLLTQVLFEFQSFTRDCDILVSEAHKQAQTRSKIHLIASALLQSRYKPILESLQTFAVNYTSLTAIDSAYREILELVRTKWMGIQVTAIQLEDAKYLQIKLQDYLRYVEHTIKRNFAHVSVSSATSSTIHATGNVCVAGHGLYGTHVESHRSILVKKSARGSVLAAERAVYVQELGSAAAAECSVAVKRREGSIYLGIRHPNTIVTLGAEQQRSDRRLENAYYRGRLPGHNYLSV